MVTTLYDAYPDAIKVKDFCGDSPLYLLYHSSKDYRILQHVLRRHPDLAVYKENVCFGQTLVKAICAPWTSKQIHISWAAMESNAILKDRWTKLVLTVRAAHRCTTEVRNSLETPELHLAMEFPCPNLVIRHFLEMYPNQASITMSNYGCHPLHYFLLHSASLHEGSAVIKSLLKAYPDVTSIRYNGQLPVNLALVAGLTWKTGISDIVFANTNVLGQSDDKDLLLPFMQAAVYGRNDLTTIFLLLRENPSVLGTLSKRLDETKQQNEKNP